VTALERALQAFPALQSGAGPLPGDHYLASGPETVTWGWLPCATDNPVLRVPNGAVVTIDTVSHEGILEDQGRNPTNFFGGFRVPGESILEDAAAIAGASLPHDFVTDGPHIITGPIAVEGAQVGDLLAIEILDLQLRSGYGIVSSRHGFGALPDELPAGAGPHFTFCTVDAGSSGPTGRIPLPGNDEARALRFPLRPFLGVMGVAAGGAERPHSVPPGPFGGNIDIRLLGVGSTLFIPIEVAEALFYVGDPHFAQGDGEVALTAFEAPLRATVRLSVRKASQVAANRIHGMTADLLVPIGLHRDLDEAMRECVRCALDLLEGGYGIDRTTGYAYLSAAGDFAVSQVVDDVKGVHGMIRRSDLPSRTDRGGPLL
jgi:acetamidase/formamidase